MLVSILNIPASTDALKTINQSTCEITAVVPIVAIAVCATVLIARTPAAFHHFFVITMCSPFPALAVNAHAVVDDEHPEH